MPRHGTRARGVAVAEPGVVAAVVGDVDLGAVGQVRPQREDDQGAKVLAKVNDGG